MGTGSLICLIGAIVQAVAQDANYLIAGRVVLGLGAIIAQTAGSLVFCCYYLCCPINIILGPAYVVELAHPAYRGILTGLLVHFESAIQFRNTLTLISQVSSQFLPRNHPFNVDRIRAFLCTWKSGVSMARPDGTPGAPLCPRINDHLVYSRDAAYATSILH